VSLKDVTWPQVVLAAIIVPSACALVYGLVKTGENIAGIAAAVAAIFAAMGWQSSRQKAQIEEVRNDVGKVEKLANGNLSRADAARDEANRKAIEHLHLIYQQAIQLAAAAPPGTVVPPLPPVLVSTLNGVTVEDPAPQQR
jgi:hypothetical protein